MPALEPEKTVFPQSSTARFWAVLGGVLLTTSLLCGQANATGGPYRFTNIGTAQGLNSAKVTSIFQDSYGFVWIGTYNGLHRFDGYEVVLFEHKPGDAASLPSSDIAAHAFYEDADRNLWIATHDAGFVKFDRRTEQFQRFQAQAGGADGLSANAVTALCGGEPGAVWVATVEGLNSFFPEQNRFYHYLNPENRPDTLTGSKLLTALCRTRDDEIWVGTDVGVTAIDRQGAFHRYFSSPGGGLRQSHAGDNGGRAVVYVNDIFEDRQGRIWIATINGFYGQVGRDSFAWYSPEQRAGLPRGAGYNYVFRVFEDRDGDFWLGTNAGLLRFDPIKDTYEVIRHDPLKPTSIRKGGISDIIEDAAGRLWFATQNDGVCVLDKKTAFLQDKNWAPVQASLPAIVGNAGVVTLAETPGRFWVGTELGLFTFRPGEAVEPFLPGVFLCFSARDSRGRHWAGTGSDQAYLFVIEPNTPRVLRQIRKQQTKTRSHDELVASAAVTAVVEDTFGFVWIGTWGALNRYDEATGQYRQFYNDPDLPHCLSNSSINDLWYDRQGTLWIATDAGVNFLLPAELQKPIDDTLLHFRQYRHDPNDAGSISSDQIRCLLEDRSGRMWFGAKAGLNLLLPDGRFRRFFREDGLPGNAISGLVEDAAGNVWVTTPNNGVVKYDPSTGRFSLLTKQDGLNTDQFFAGACLKTSDGKLVFAGQEGVNCFDPAQIGLQPDSMPLYFVALKLFNRPVKPGGADGILQQPLYMTREIALDFSQNVLSIQFAALNFTNPDKQAYRYRLEGFSALENWQDLGHSREITLTNLFPGVYTLRVESTAQPDNRAHWESAAALVIRVRYPWGAILSYSGIFFAVLFVFYKLRVRRKLAAAEARRLQELDAVKTQLYTNITHEFRTPLTVILGEAAQLEKQAQEKPPGGLAAIRRQGRQLLDLVNQMLDLAKAEAGSLRLRLIQGNVILYLKYLLESFHSLADDKRIALRFESDTDEFWMDYDPEKLRQITANLLSNALKFTPEGGQVTLRATTREQLVFQVLDTGAGIAPEHLPHIFDRFYQADDTAVRQGEGTGIGLTLAKELIQLMGGRLGAESRMGQGSVFTVTLPVKRTAEKQTAPPGDFFAENKEIVPETLAGSPLKSKTPPPAAANLQQLLLIEDNPDVVRYISSLLAADYDILVARNGKDGLEMAFRRVPDLVISDVMMPEMDGFEVCRALKTDFRTSHIPIILLTAKADLDSRIEGLERGADAYLAKPFEERELRVHLRKLHELRQALLKRYGGPGLPALSDSPVFQREDAFFAKLLAQLERHFSDDAFGVPELCVAMEMTRPTLFRKLTALTGKNIEDYLRAFRLRKAYELLKTTDRTVEAIAWDCGFKEAANFSRAFHAEFGFSPGTLRS